MGQEGCATVLNKVRPQHHGETTTSEARGVSDSGVPANALKPSQSPFTTSPLSQLASIPAMKNSETEVPYTSSVSRCIHCIGPLLEPPHKLVQFFHQRLWWLWGFGGFFVIAGGEVAHPKWDSSHSNGTSSYDMLLLLLFARFLPLWIFLRFSEHDFVWTCSAAFATPREDRGSWAWERSASWTVEP